MNKGDGRDGEGEENEITCNLNTSLGFQLVSLD
jgi:hypothetical protein